MHPEILDFQRRLRICLMGTDKTMRDIASETGVSHATVSRVGMGKLPDLENYFLLKAWVDKSYDAARAKVLSEAGVGSGQ